jgi:hypothetical protein
LMVATPELLIAARGMRTIRTPVDGAATAVTVPGLLIAVDPGSRTEMLLDVPVVMTRRNQPADPAVEPGMVSEALGVMALGVVPVETTDCGDRSAIRRTSFWISDRRSAEQRTVI